MAILSYQLADAFARNPDGSVFAERAIAATYNSVTLALLTLDVDNSASPNDHTMTIAGNSVSTPAHSHQTHDLSPLSLLVASARGVLKPPSWST